MLFFSSHRINTTGDLNGTKLRYQLPHNGTSHNGTAIGTFPHSNHTGHGPSMNHTMPLANCTIMNATSINFTSRADTISNGTTTQTISSGNVAAFGVISCIIVLLFCFLGFAVYYIYRVHQKRKLERVAFLGRDSESGKPNKLPPFPGVSPKGKGEGDDVARASPYTFLPAPTPAPAPFLTIPRKLVAGTVRTPSDGWNKKWDNTAQQLAAQDEYSGASLADNSDSDGGNSIHSSQRSTAPILPKPALVRKSVPCRAPLDSLPDSDGFTSIPLDGGKRLTPLPALPASRKSRSRKLSEALAPELAEDFLWCHIPEPWYNEDMKKSKVASGKSKSAAPIIPECSSSKAQTRTTETREVRFPTFDPADDDDGFHSVDLSFDADGKPVPWCLAPVKMEMDLEVFMSKQPKKAVVVEQTVVHAEAQLVEIEIWED